MQKQLKNRAICVDCGSWKETPMSTCVSCGRTPVADVDRAKSLILSLDYEVDDEYLGKSAEELGEISNNIKAGQVFQFDADEIHQLIKHANDISAIPTRRLVIDGLRWFAPVLIVILILAILMIKGKM